MNKRIRRFVFLGLIGACSSTLLGTAVSLNQSKPTTKFFQKLASAEEQKVTEQAEEINESSKETPYENSELSEEPEVDQDSEINQEPMIDDERESDEALEVDDEDSETSQESEIDEEDEPDETFEFDQDSEVSQNPELNQKNEPDKALVVNQELKTNQIESNKTIDAIRKPEVKQEPETVQKVMASPYLDIKEDGTIVGVTREGRMQREIVIPITAQTIGEEAFMECKRLQKVVIPNTISRIEKRAFKGCSQLQKIIIPESVTKMGSSIFDGCDSLNESNVFNHSPVLFDWWVNNHRYNGVLIKDTREVDLSLYKNSSNKHFTKLGRYALLRCLPLQKIIIPSHITGIDAGNLDGCINLKPENVINNSQVIFDWWVQNHLYRGGTLFNIIVNTNRLDLAQYRNSSNEQFKYISEEAFSECFLLVEMNLPESIIEIADSAFSRCQSLKRINISGALTKIGNGAFSECQDLVDINIPSSLTELGSYAFFKCRSLRSIQIGPRIATINAGTFLSCSNLQTIHLPEKLQAIRWAAFQGCISLQSIALPDTIMTIGQYAFAVCESLRIARLPRNLAVVSEGLFYNCQQLVEINIPQGVVTIYKEAFYGCSSLKKIVIPKSTRVLGNSLFGATYNLKEIYILGIHLDFSQGLIDAINDHVEFYIADFRLISSLRSWGIADQRIHPIRAVSSTSDPRNESFEPYPYLVKKQEASMFGKIKNFFWNLAGQFKDAAVYVKKVFF